MASEFTLIDDIIKNHNERMLNLRKFYPFFMLSDNTFAQYKDGRFRFIDMGYMALAILRFFINENSFNDKPVTYSEYSEFCLKTIKRDFDPEGEWSDYSRDELNELVRYIFEKLRNNGRAFEYSFYDPSERKSKIARVRLIDSTVKEEEVVYTITEDGIEFYLSTKEVRDESRINMDQLLLEKLIRSENFRGSIDVIQRINIEVRALEKKREEVMSLLISDVHLGTAAMDEYMDTVSVWFAEERKSFARNRELVDKAVARLTYGDDTKTLRDITRLQTLLKQTIESHSALIAATAELSRFSDEMVRRSRTRSLKNSFDFEAALSRIIANDKVERLGDMIMPFMQPKREKSLAISTIDNIILQKTGESLKGEKREELKADLGFKYDDEILNENVGRNYAHLFKELIGRLKRWEELTLEELNAILEVKFGKAIYKNRDYYSFLVHLAGKSIYSVADIKDSAETFLEEMVNEHLTEEELGDLKDICFEIKFDDEEIQIKSEDGKLAELTGMRFVRVPQAKVERRTHTDGKIAGEGA
ncbi:MAG: hypothetical protein K5865_02735 [Eubacterium sp.]|nr:hypothetical protein [Eubacterium sp.]